MKEIIARDYQVECAEAWVSAFDKPCSPLVAVPTGAGKTIIVCEFLTRWFEKHPDSNVLILSHTQEIVQQDYDTLISYFPAFGLGIYSAGLSSKEIKKVTVGSIQSVWRNTELFTNFDLCLVDEVHSVNHKKAGMYRKFFEELGCRVGGMSATVFRTGHGYIHEGKDTLFDHLAYDLTSVSQFNNLVRQGYLTKLISKAPEFELDSSTVKKVAGEYNLKDLAATHDRAEVTKAAVAEAVKSAEGYKKWLVFAIDIQHATHIRQELEEEHGIKAEELHMQMSGDRSTVINNFKCGNTQALVSVGMVTTGFDAPNVDCIVLLRPTMSPVLHVQMVGRGLRVHPGKEHCLVLDFACNTERLGPINDPIVKGKKRKDGLKKGEAPTKKCPICRTITFAIARFCDMCGHEFVRKTKLKVTASTEDVVRKDGPLWKDVQDVRYYIHAKEGSANSLKVVYTIGLSTVAEWVCLNHTGYAKYKADQWLGSRWSDCPLKTTKFVYEHSDMLRVPKRIQIGTNKRFKTVVNAQF